MQGIKSSRTGRGRYFAVKDGSAEAVDQESRLEEILMGMEEDVDLGMAIMGMEEDLEVSFSCILVCDLKIQALWICIVKCIYF